MVVVELDVVVVVVVVVAVGAPVSLLWRPGRRSPVNVFFSDG